MEKNRTEPDRQTLIMRGVYPIEVFEDAKFWRKSNTEKKIPDKPSQKGDRTDGAYKHWNVIL